MVQTSERAASSQKQHSSVSCQQIAAYLSQAIALQPPLRVEGVPPFLHIYLDASHVYQIAHILPAIKRSVAALQGSKCWEIYVYCGNTTEDPSIGERSRLIAHHLLEATPREQASSSLPPLGATKASKMPRLLTLTAVRSSITSTTPPSPLVRTALPQPVVTRPEKDVRPSSLRDHLVQRQRTRRRKMRVALALGIGIGSFVAGILAATGIQLVQSISTPVAARQRFTNRQPELSEASLEPLPAQQLEPVMPPDVADSINAAASESRSPASSSWWQPITPTGSLTAAANLLTVPPEIQPAVSLKAVGDIIPGTNFPNYRIPDPSYLFNSVKMFMGEVDILFGNFESTLTDYPYSAKNVGQGMTFAFRTPPSFATVLRAAGFDVLSIANNHSFDFGDPGFNDTFTYIEQAGMQAVGRKDEITVLEANGYAIAFIGFSYWPDHNDMNNLTTATQLVQAAKAQADMVVVSVHAGAEGTDALRIQNQTEYFFSENRGNMVQFSRAMIDAGADLILGHGPHVPRALELYQNRLIAYSLGNFVGYRTLSTVGPLGKSMILQVELNPAGEFLRGRIIPVALDPNGVPYVDDFFESVTLVRQLTQKDFPETPVTIDQMGYILRTNRP